MDPVGVLVVLGVLVGLPLLGAGLIYLGLLAWGELEMRSRTAGRIGDAAHAVADRVSWELVASVAVLLALFWALS